MFLPQPMHRAPIKPCTPTEIHNNKAMPPLASHTRRKVDFEKRSAYGRSREKLVMLMCFIEFFTNLDLTLTLDGNPTDHHSHGSTTDRIDISYHATNIERCTRPARTQLRHELGTAAGAGGPLATTAQRLSAEQAWNPQADSIIAVRRSILGRLGFYSPLTHTSCSRTRSLCCA